MSNDENRPSHASAGWRCASCGDLIRKVEDGWVEWLACLDSKGNTRLQGLRLVHNHSASPRAASLYACQYDPLKEFWNGESIVEGLPLERFVGADGLMLLLSMFSQDELPRDQLLELAKRVQIPGYELTHELLHQAIVRGAFNPSIGDGYYLQSEIWALFKWVDEETKSA